MDGDDTNRRTTGPPKAKIGRTAYMSNLPKNYTVPHRHTETLLEASNGTLKVGAHRRHDTEQNLDLGQAKSGERGQSGSRRAHTHIRIHLRCIVGK